MKRTSRKNAGALGSSLARSIVGGSHAPVLAATCPGSLGGFQQQVAKCNAAAWPLVACEDLRCLATQASRPSRLTWIIYRYAD